MNAAQNDVDKLPGIKRREITNCALCGKGLAHNGAIMFNRVKVERFAFDYRQIRQLRGLEEFFGGGSPGAVLASVMGTDADLAKCMNPEVGAKLVCDMCAFSNTALLVLAEDP